MLQASHLTKKYTSQILFEDVTFALSKGEKLGLVGRNGSGKSTLFKIILGEEEPDEGQIITPKNYRVGALKQYLKFSEDTVLKECCLSLPSLHKHEEYRAQKILSGLGFDQVTMNKHPSQFSGGFQVRLSLAKLLVTDSDLLLLDEPTNYLDIVSIRWLTNFLKAFSGEFILITHDKGFMDNVCSHTMGIHRKNMIKVHGHTNKYYNLLQQEEEHYYKQKTKQEQAVKKMQTYIDKYRATARRSNQAQSRMKKLSKLQEMAELEQESTLNFCFHYKECPAKFLSEFQNYSFTYPGMQKILIKDFDLFVKDHDRIAIIGKNGTGKSTLINLMARELTTLTGKNFSHPQTEIGFFGQMNIDRLNEHNTVETEIGSANTDLTYGQIRSICGLMMFEGDNATKKINVLSGGEKSRVLLGRILAKSVNLLLLDEPTNHLDQESIDGLIQGFEKFKGAVVMVTHNEMILKRFAKRLIIFQNDEILVFEGGYDDFLRQIGWAGEENSQAQRQSSPRLRKKDLRRERSQEREERSRILKPLRKKIKELEKQIQKREISINEKTQDLLKASTTNEIETQINLSKDIKNMEKAVENLYDDLDNAIREYEKANEDLS